MHRRASALLVPHRILADFTGQLKHSAYLVFPISLLLITIVAVAATRPDIEFVYFAKDVLSFGNLPYYAGAISTLGLLLWAMTAGICLIMICALHEKLAFQNRRFLYFSAFLLTLCLMLDDAYMAHEGILPNYAGISEKKILLGYMLVTLLQVITTYRQVFASNYIIWAASLGFFTLSMVADLELLESVAPWFSKTEEAFKLFGIGFWLCFYADCAIADIRKLQAPV